MNDNNYYSEYSESSAEVSSVTDTNIAFAKSYLFMFLGTFITLIVGLFFSKMLGNFMIEGNAGGQIGFLIAFFIVMIVEMIICTKINKESLVYQNFGKSLTLFLVYSALNGFMFSFLFVYFDLSVLIQVFFGVSIYFLLLSIVTFIFRKKIHRAAGFAYAGLLVLLIASVVMSLLSWFMYGSEVFFNLYLGISLIVFKFPQGQLSSWAANSQ